MTQQKIFEMNVEFDKKYEECFKDKNKYHYIDLRNKYHLTQQDIADYLHVSKMAISRFERFDLTSDTIESAYTDEILSKIEEDK